MESEFRLNSRFYGVQSARYPAAAMLKDKVAVPLGGEVHIRSLSNLEVETRFKAADDTVMVLLPCFPLSLVAMAYSGSVGLYGLDGVRKAQTQASQRTLRHGAVSEDGKLVCACGEFGPANGTIDVWSLETGQFVQIFKLVGNYRFPEFTPQNCLFAMRETVLEPDLTSTFRKDQPLDPAQATLDFPAEAANPSIDIEASRAVRRENRTNCYFSCLFDLSGTANSLKVETVSYIVCSKNNQKGKCALLYLSRDLLVMDMERLEILASCKIAGAGAIIALTMVDDWVYFSPGSRLITQIRVGGGKLPELLEVISPNNEAVTTVKTAFECLSKGLYHLSWVSKDRELFVCEENGVFLCSFPNFPSPEGATCISETGHSTTCCGVALNKAGSLLCSGDFTGQVFVWAIETDLHQPIARFSVVLPI